MAAIVSLPPTLSPMKKSRLSDEAPAFASTLVLLNPVLHDPLLRFVSLRNNEIRGGTTDTILCENNKGKEVERERDRPEREGGREQIIVQTLYPKLRSCLALPRCLALSRPLSLSRALVSFALPCLVPFVVLVRLLSILEGDKASDKKPVILTPDKKPVIY